jgi:hypothetical protein
MNIEVNELCEIAKNPFEKYVYSIGVCHHTIPLLVYIPLIVPKVQ